jgi:RIO-like serine/threonine protein kinase
MDRGIQPKDRQMIYYGTTEKFRRFAMAGDSDKKMLPGSLEAMLGKEEKAFSQADKKIAALKEEKVVETGKEFTTGREIPPNQEIKLGARIGPYTLARKLQKEEIHDEHITELAQRGLGEVYQAWDTSTRKSLQVAMVGRYIVVKRLGAGGMGAVYKAYDVELSRYVALKTIILHNEASLERFKNEAKSLARLFHPNIVNIHDLGSRNENYYFIMDLIEGDDLEKWIRGSMPKETSMVLWARKAAAIMQKVAKAIAYAHEHKIIHRDIKPANILLDTKETPFVTDFGLAKELESGGSSLSGVSKTGVGLTETGQIVGTLLYMPPEQAKGKEVDERSDVYALGAVWFLSDFLFWLFCLCATNWHAARQIAKRLFHLQRVMQFFLL